MQKRIDNIGPSKDNLAKPTSKHKAGEIVRPKGQTPGAGDIVKPKGYQPPKSEDNARVISEEERASQRSTRQVAQKKVIVRSVAFGVAIVVSLLLISLLFGWIQRFTREQAQKKNVNIACSTNNQDLIASAITSINTQNLSSLESEVNQIKSLDNYLLDQNCLAIITWQAILKGDALNAQATSGTIKQYYEARFEKGADGTLYTSNPEKISSAISDLETRLQQRQQRLQNFTAGGPEL